MEPEWLQPGPIYDAAVQTIRELSAGETGSAWPAMRELRPHIPGEPEFVAIVDETLRPQGYRLLAAFEDGSAEPVAVAGFRVSHSLAWGRYLYVDDLVTRAAARSRGHGACLIAWLRDEATRLGCDQLHLDSGVQRADAHRFYQREGLTPTSLHFACRLERP